MSSRSDAAVTDETTNVAIDRRAVLDSGTQIVDSVIFDSAPEEIQSMMTAFIASWETMVSANTFNLVELTDMGGQVLDLARRNQIQMTETTENMLESVLGSLDANIRQGALVIGVAEETIEQSFDLSSDALDIVAEVKTGDFTSISYAVMAFALIAIYMTRKV